MERLFSARYGHQCRILINQATQLGKTQSCWKTVPELYKYLYNSNMNDIQPIEFRGTSLEDLRDFPISARREAGYQLDIVQRGSEPSDWRPLTTIGKGVREIRIRDASGAFRVIYVAKFAKAVYVLHCFQKKTQRTSRRDLNLAMQRYQELVKEIQK